MDKDARALKKAMSLLRRGEDQEARDILAKIIAGDVHNELAWLAYSSSLVTKTERIKALEECLHHNPDWSEAKARLAALQKPEAPTPIPQSPTTKQCPDCAEEIKAEARVCRYCGAEQNGKGEDIDYSHAGIQPAKILALIGSAAIVIGSVLPWAQVVSGFGTVSVAGYQGDGLITGGVGLIFLIASVLSLNRAGLVFAVTGVLGALLTGWIAIDKVGLLMEGAPDIAGRFSVGAGIYVTALGAVILSFGAIGSGALVGGAMSDSDREKADRTTIWIFIGGAVLIGLILGAPILFEILGVMSESSLPFNPTPRSRQTAAREDGFFRVGVDIAPGLWEASRPGARCYSARLDRHQDVLDQRSGKAGGTVTIRSTDYAVEFEHCGIWRYAGP